MLPFAPALLSTTNVAFRRVCSRLPAPAEAKLIADTEALLLEQMSADELAKLRLAGAALPSRHSR